MNNKLAKAMIERVTPVKNDSYFPFNTFPWSSDLMCPYTQAESQRDARILKKLKRRLSDDLYQHVIDVMEDNDGGFGLSIVRDMPFNVSSYEGCMETEDEDGNIKEVENSLGRYWIDERENGGYSGDSYSGFVYIQISRLDYLKFSYSM